jgi:hypothetical protein
MENFMISLEDSFMALRQMKMFLLMIGPAIFAAYCIYAFVTVGMKSSISDTYFHVKYPFFFRMFLWGISLPIIIYSIGFSYSIMTAGALIARVGFAAGSKQYEDKENGNHVIGATGGIVVALLGFIIEHGWKNWLHISSWNEFNYGAIAMLLAAFIILPVKGVKKPVRYHTTFIEIFEYAIVVVVMAINFIRIT